MKLTTHFLNRPANREAVALCSNCRTAEFATVLEAEKAATTEADHAAFSFVIVNEDEEELARWERAGSTWRKMAPQARK